MDKMKTLLLATGAVARLQTGAVIVVAQGIYQKRRTLALGVVIVGISFQSFTHGGTA